MKKDEEVKIFSYSDLANRSIYNCIWEELEIIDSVLEEQMDNHIQMEEIDKFLKDLMEENEIQLGSARDNT